MDDYVFKFRCPSARRGFIFYNLPMIKCGPCKSNHYGNIVMIPTKRMSEILDSGPFNQRMEALKKYWLDKPISMTYQESKASKHGVKK